MGKPVRAKKSYGQHFLHRADLAEKIARSLILEEDCKHVMEIGPGKGMLTQFLIDQPYTFTAVEADYEMVDYLKENFDFKGNRLIGADFLKLDIKEHFKEEPFAIVGNFPYNISSQILFKMLDHREQIPQLVGMFQKEVAQRVVAPPGNKVYGVISVLIQAFYEGKYLFTVGKGAFNPPPKVQSGVIRLTRKSNPDLGCDPSLFKAVVKQAFSQRRKMLRNTMKAFLKDDPILQDPFFQLRPEKLSVEEFINLTNQISTIQEKNK